MEFLNKTNLHNIKTNLSHTAAMQLVRVRTWATQLVSAIWRYVKRLSYVSLVLMVLGVMLLTYAVNVAVPHAHNVYSLAKLIDGEARGEPVRGQKAAFATVLERVARPDFPDTIHGVAYQPYNTTNKVLQYNAMGDVWHENLGTSVGQTILRRVAFWYTMEQFGLFQAPAESAGAHSYCVPAACSKSADFKRWEKLASIGNHDFYTSPLPATKKASGAVTVSLRPVLRPQQAVLVAPSQLAPRTSLRPVIRTADTLAKAIVRDVVGE